MYFQLLYLARQRVISEGARHFHNHFETFGTCRGGGGRARPARTNQTDPSAERQSTDTDLKYYFEEHRSREPEMLGTEVMRFLAVTAIQSLPRSDCDSYKNSLSREALVFIAVCFSCVELINSISPDNPVPARPEPKGT